MADVKFTEADLHRFAHDPSKYFIQMKPCATGHTFHLMKKNLFTHFVICIGSYLGLFNKNTIALNEVAKSILLYKDQFASESMRPFCDAFDYTVIKWNSRRTFSSNASKIETIHSHQGELRLKLKAPSVYHTWIDQDDEVIAASVIKRTENAWNVRMGHCLVNGKARERSILFTPLSDLKFSGLPKIEMISKIFRENPVTEKFLCKQEINNALSLSPSVEIIFFAPDEQDEQDECEVVFKIPSMV